MNRKKCILRASLATLVGLTCSYVLTVACGGNTGTAPVTCMDCSNGGSAGAAASTAVDACGGCENGGAGGLGGVGGGDPVAAHCRPLWSFEYASRLADQGYQSGWGCSYDLITVGVDGTVYQACSKKGVVFAISPSGEQKLSYQLPLNEYSPSAFSPSVVGNLLFLGGIGWLSINRMAR